MVRSYGVDHLLRFAVFFGQLRADERMGTLDLMIYGALIVLICIFKPEGLVGAVKMHREVTEEEKTDESMEGVYQAQVHQYF